MWKPLPRHRAATGGSDDDSSDGSDATGIGEEETMADAWRHNKHTLYELAVQKGGFWMERFAVDFASLRNKREPRSLREDFCGTFSNCCSWVQMHGENTAVGVDNDPEVLEFGKEEFGASYSMLEEEQQQRIRVVLGDVLVPSPAASSLPTACATKAKASAHGPNGANGPSGAGPFDLICALNFSYSVFKERATLVQVRS